MKAVKGAPASVEATQLNGGNMTQSKRDVIIHKSGLWLKQTLLPFLMVCMWLACANSGVRLKVNLTTLYPGLFMLQTVSGPFCHHTKDDVPDEDLGCLEFQGTQETLALRTLQSSEI